MLNLAITQTELAEIAGVTKGAVWQWLQRRTLCPANHCVSIERATAGRVMRWALRPADWHLIWPELIERPDAPPLPSALPACIVTKAPKRGRRPKAPDAAPSPSAAAPEAAAPDAPKPKRGRPRRKSASSLVGLKGGFEPQTPQPAQKVANELSGVCPHCGRCVHCAAKGSGT